MLLKKKSKIAELREPEGLLEERRPKVHAQRKFAQGSPSFPFFKDREKENGVLCQTTSSQVPCNDLMNDIIPDVCPNTEDFLAYLCFRSFPNVLPDSLKYFGDPLRHNFPDGIPTSDKSKSSTNSNSKQESNTKPEEKSSEPKSSATTKLKSLKDSSKMKKTSATTSSKIGSVGRIHSNFRRTIAASGIMTRMARIKTRTDHPIAKPLKSQKVIKSQKRTPLLVSKRVTTRSQIRNTKSEESRTKKDSLSSKTTLNDAETRRTRKLPSVPVRTQNKNMQQNKNDQRLKSAVEARKSKIIPHKKIAAITTPTSRSTRLSSAKSQLEVSSQSPKRKSTEEKPISSPKVLRRKSLIDSKTSTESKKSSMETRCVQKTISPPAKFTRKLSKQLKEQSFSLTALPARRPSRRTKEAATFFMTLIGQEEDFYSSEMEDNSQKSTKESPPPKKKLCIEARKSKFPSSSLPSVMRTRRHTVGVTLSPAKRRAAILQEASKRFTVAKCSDSSDESESEASSSSSEEEVPVRNIRTRSFDPSQVVKPKSVVAKVITDARKTRATAVKNEQPEKTSTTKVPVQNDASTKTKVAAEKNDTNNRKRPISRKSTVTPPLSYDLSSLIEAPVFYPNEKEFNDPMEYLEKIRPDCERFGICRIVPPASFKPECQVSDAMRFTAYNQYIHRMFRRRGSNSRILEAIHRHLRGLNIDYQPAPCIGGIEVDLPGLYEAVENLGGAGYVLENNLWSKVADTLKVPKTAQDRFSKLDAIYCKYLLPYATLSDDERNKLLTKVDSQQNRRSSEDEDEDECIVKGSSIALSTFYRIARNTSSIWFPNVNSTTTDTAVLDPAQVEATFWKLVTRRTSHVCVYSGNIDSGQAGYGFPCNKTSRHPWNLKVLTNNNGSVLRSLGPVPGCTAPTLHVNMLFSASCWYRDPHGLPWIDYLHTGADKIWYGVPSLQEPILRKAMTKIVPDLVKGDKSVWLPSDTVMVPPTMLAEEGVSLSRTVQKSGQFVVVWPQAFTSSFSTGYNVSESVYFAPLDWLPIGDSCFKELRINNEPTVFSLQQLLWNIAHDCRSTVNVLKSVFPLLQPSVEEEVRLRSSLRNFSVQNWEKLPTASETNQRESKKKQKNTYSSNDDMECALCQTSLFFSRAEYCIRAESPVTWCLTHALQKIKDRPRVTQHIKVLYAYDEDELRQAVQRIQDSIRTKSSSRKTGSHQRSSTL